MGMNVLEMKETSHLDSRLHYDVWLVDLRSLRDDDATCSWQDLHPRGG